MFQCVLITGSNGLIGSEAVAYYVPRSGLVIGIDNNTRAKLFGPMGDTSLRTEKARKLGRNFRHLTYDIRDKTAISDLFASHPIDLVIHCAAQPSHDLSAHLPFVDFQINAMGTCILLECVRQYRPDAVFVLLSTNKVYGDAPNEYPVIDTGTRLDYARVADHAGIDESCRIDRSMHSPFGASKLAADIMTQEYGRYFGLRTGVFRAGCLTGPNHAGVPLHGFLSYLVRTAVNDGVYTIIGYDGKQVRDQLHAADVIAACDAFANNPRPGEVYNLGGGRNNSASVLESIALIEGYLDRRIHQRYVAEPRRGDHRCYISDTSKFRRDFPRWQVTRSVPRIVNELIAHTEGRTHERT